MTGFIFKPKADTTYLISESMAVAVMAMVVVGQPFTTYKRNPVLPFIIWSEAAPVSFPTFVEFIHHIKIIQPSYFAASFHRRKSLIPRTKGIRGLGIIILTLEFP